MKFLVDCGQRERSLPLLEKVFLSFSRHLPISFWVIDPVVSAEVHKPVQNLYLLPDEVHPCVVTATSFTARAKGD